MCVSCESRESCESQGAGCTVGTLSWKPEGSRPALPWTLIFCTRWSHVGLQEAGPALPPST